MHMQISHSVVLAAISFGVFANAAPQRYSSNVATGPVEAVPAGIVKRNNGCNQIPFNDNNNFNHLRNEHGEHRCRDRECFGCGGGGCGGGGDGERLFSDNQIITQNLLANQNLMASLPIHDFFISDKSTGRSSIPVTTINCVPSNSVNTKDEFEVNNKIDFKGTGGFFKVKRQEPFSDNHNQNINQNIDTNQNLNVDFFHNLSGFSNTRSFLPFLGGGNRKRDLGVEKRTFSEGSAGCVYGSGSQNKNININKNYNTLKVLPVEVETVEYVPVVEEVPVPCTVPTTEVVKEVERVPYLDVEVSYPCGCVDECGCCPGTTNDAQAVAAPVVNNYINIESAAIPKVDVKTDNCSGSNSDATSVPQVDITSAPCAKPITVVEPVTTCRTCKRDNYINLGCPCEVPVKPVEVVKPVEIVTRVKEIETVKPVEVVAPIVNTVKDVQPVEVIQPVVHVVQPVIEEHVKPVYTETVKPTIVNHTVDPCTVHKRDIVDVTGDYGYANPVDPVAPVKDCGYVAPALIPAPVVPSENCECPHVEVAQPVEVPVEVNVQQPVEVRPVCCERPTCRCERPTCHCERPTCHCERPTCHCVRPCYRPCRQPCPSYRCNDCYNASNIAPASAPASPEVADLEAVVAELSEATTNCNENKNININTKRSDDCQAYRGQACRGRQALR
ncbi:hypothetical protein BDD12DRAFT_910764 [Trichophaea hybrida]|nr:hypothetical protein BDD12DRAFT_910764 [Trichophaea hybrida]